MHQSCWEIKSVGQRDTYGIIYNYCSIICYVQDTESR